MIGGMHSAHFQVLHGGGDGRARSKLLAVLQSLPIGCAANKRALDSSYSNELREIRAHNAAQTGGMTTLAECEQASDPWSCECGAAIPRVPGGRHGFP